MNGFVCCPAKKHFKNCRGALETKKNQKHESTMVRGVELRKLPPDAGSYNLIDPDITRRRALLTKINFAAQKGYPNIRKAAIAVKARLNVLRIWRRRSKKAQCRKITRDMRYIDSTFLGPNAVTNQIC